MSRINFTPIDPGSWERREVFWYFSEMAPTGYSLTIDIDVTKMLGAVRSAGVRFFPAYLWLATKCFCEQKEFRIAVKDGAVGYYDTLTPLYATFHDDTKTFSLMWTEYHDDFMEFFRSYMEDRRRYDSSRGILSKTGQLPPENAYTVSCVPWISFRHFAVHSYENKPYYFPSAEAGKFFEKDGRTMMPLSITCHHAATDGYHVSRFLESFQYHADHFEELMII